VNGLLEGNMTFRFSGWTVADMRRQGRRTRSLCGRIALVGLYCVHPCVPGRILRFKRDSFANSINAAQ
jgi:hypothetical protein